jgi:hypothetical protein
MAKYTMKTLSDYIWADAWFLLAVSYVSPNGETAELSAVIGAADFINHAILTHREIESATHKLTRDGWIEYSDGKFMATEEMLQRFSELPEGTPIDQMETVESWLNASEYESGYDPNAETGFLFPDITEQMVNSAAIAYTRR